MGGKIPGSAFERATTLAGQRPRWLRERVVVTISSRLAILADAYLRSNDEPLMPAFVAHIDDRAVQRSNDMLVEVDGDIVLCRDPIGRLRRWRKGQPHPAGCPHEPRPSV